MNFTMKQKVMQKRVEIRGPKKRSSLFHICKAA